jgi:hypothetical protein
MNLMPMTFEQIAVAPQHPQLMDPADPEQLIQASIWWYPRLFANRTAVLQHLLDCGGNGYAWDGSGQIRSVFSHLEPDYAQIGEPADEQLPAALEELRRRDLATLAQIRATASTRARTHGRVTISRGHRPGGGGGLLASRPGRVHPRWQPLLGEAEHVFAQARAVQQNAELRLRRQWDRNPAARAAQLLTRWAGRAWAAGDMTDAELEACDQILAAWRHPAWPSRLDRQRLQHQRDRNRARRDLVRQILADLHAGRQPSPGPEPGGETDQHRPGRGAPRNPGDILSGIAEDRFAAASLLVRPVPFLGWHEPEWTLEVLRQRAAEPGVARGPAA